MAGYIDRYTEAQVAAYSKKIKGIYGQAAKEVRKKLDSFLAGQKVIGARMLEQVKRGEITEADYKKWLSGQVFIGDRWKAKLAEITDIYMNADRKAREMLGGTTKQVFAESANRTAYDMSRDLRGAVSFNLYDTKTVDRLLKDDPKMLPEWKINEKKDYVWNEKRVRNSVTQGIIQGESVYDIGKRLTSELATDNADKMDMFARTAVTGAQNAGRVERMKETEESGIKVKKKWIAAHDNRTRDTHADLDGQEVDVDEKFKTFDGREIDYPGDPTADPDLVYNCRCTLVYVYPKYEPKTESHHFESYSEWKAKQPQEEKRTRRVKQEEPQKEEPQEPENLRQFNKYDVESRTMFQKMKQANPHYRDGKEYRINCQRTVVAEELIQRGYDVEALPYNENDIIKDSGIACWNVAPGWARGNDPFITLFKTASEVPKGVSETMSSWGDGSRAILRIQWQGGGGHFLSVVQTEGRTVVMDPQKGLYEDLDELKRKLTKKNNSMWLMRVDNRELTDAVKFAVKNRE